MPVKRTIPWKGGEAQVIPFPVKNTKLLDVEVMIRQSLSQLILNF